MDIDYTYNNNIIDKDENISISQAKKIILQKYKKEYDFTINSTRDCKYLNDKVEDTCWSFDHCDWGQRDRVFIIIDNKIFYDNKYHRKIIDKLHITNTDKKIKYTTIDDYSLKIDHIVFGNINNNCAFINSWSDKINYHTYDNNNIEYLNQILDILKIYDKVYISIDNHEVTHAWLRIK